MPQTPKLDFTLDPAGETTTRDDGPGDRPRVDSDARGVGPHPATRRAEDGPLDDVPSEREPDDDGKLAI